MNYYEVVCIFASFTTAEMLSKSMNNNSRQVSESKRIGSRPAGLSVLLHCQLYIIYGALRVTTNRSIKNNRCSIKWIYPVSFNMIINRIKLGCNKQTVQSPLYPGLSDCLYTAHLQLWVQRTRCNYLITSIKSTSLRGRHCTHAL